MANKKSRIPLTATFSGVEDPKRLSHRDRHVSPTSRRENRHETHEEQLTQSSMTEDNNKEDTFYAVANQVVSEVRPAYHGASPVTFPMSD